MKKITIAGGKELKGTVRISGMKNAAVALIPAAILAGDAVTICNVPDISDVDALEDILKYLGATTSRSTESIVIDPSTIKNRQIPQYIAKKLRASYYFMGALLGKYKKVQMYFPGGCSIGKRPIDIHLKGFKALGAKVTTNGNNYLIEAKKLKGNNIYLDFPSVGATINIMLAATLAEGTTIIENAAREPHIVNVATFLNSLGARISGAGTSKIKIVGVESLTGGFHEVIPDQIEAGTYAIIAALIGKKVKIENIIPEHLDAIVSKLKTVGANIQEGPDYIVIGRGNEYKHVNIKTAVYPGFPTDLQQPFTVLLTQCSGKSIVDETIWENRFMYIPELNKMGADILVEGSKAIVVGPTELKGNTVVATDLRAGAALIAAALTADGKTVIEEAEHVLRGYENIAEKLTELGADIKISK